MRDAADTITVELVGFPPLPPIPPKKTPQDQRRAAMGFEGPRTRASCQFCASVQILALNTRTCFEAVQFRCIKGDFPVQRGAICAEFAAAGPR